MIDPGSGPGVRVEIGASGYAVYPPRSSWGPRVVTEHELVWIMEGNVQWICNGVSYALGPGDVVLVRSGMEDRFNWDRRHTTRHGFFHFRVLEARTLPPEERWPLVRSMPPDDLVRPLFRFVLANPAVPIDGWAERRQHEAATILWTFVCDAFALGGLGTSNLDPIVDRVLGYLHESWAEPPLARLTLGHLAGVAAVSEPHLCRVFTRTLGHSPMAVVRFMRIYWGALALAWSDLSVGQVAEQAGFPDLFHFSRRFRDVYGMPPSTFRRQYALGTAFVDSLPPGAATAAARLWGGREVAVTRVSTQGGRGGLGPADDSAAGSPAKRR